MWETPHVTTTVGSLWVKGCSAASTSLRFLASESVWRRVTGSGQGCCGPPPLTDLSARKHKPGSVTCCLDCTDSYVCSPVFVGVVDMHPLCTRWEYHHAGCSALIGLLLVGKKMRLALRKELMFTNFPFFDNPFLLSVWTLSIRKTSIMEKIACR